jgi:hypothetical protein
MEPEGSLLHSEEHTACPSPVPDQSDPCPPSHLLKIHFNLIPHLRLGLPTGLFSSGVPTKTLYAPLLSPTRVTCLAHLILIFILQFESV